MPDPCSIPLYWFCLLAAFFDVTYLYAFFASPFFATVSIICVSGPQTFWMLGQIRDLIRVHGPGDFVYRKQKIQHA